MFKSKTPVLENAKLLFAISFALVIVEALYVGWMFYTTGMVNTDLVTRVLSNVAGVFFGLSAIAYSKK
jgi:hypothetical protein